MAAAAGPTRIIFVEADGRRMAVEARIGDTVMRAARAAGVEGIRAECGGCMSCLTCHCFVPADHAGKIPPPSSEERALLDCVMERRDTSRLSCQIVVSPQLEDMVFELPEWQG